MEVITVIIRALELLAVLIVIKESIDKYIDRRIEYIILKRK